MEFPLCFTCKYCKLARKKNTLENVWNIKCKIKIFAFKISMNYPQVACCDYSKKKEEE